MIPHIALSEIVSVAGEKETPVGARYDVSGIKYRLVLNHRLMGAFDTKTLLIWVCVPCPTDIIRTDRYGIRAFGQLTRIECGERFTGPRIAVNRQTHFAILQSHQCQVCGIIGYMLYWIQ